MKRLIEMVCVSGLALGTAADAFAQGKGTSPQPRPPGTGTEQSNQERATNLRYMGRLLIGDAGPDFELPAADGPAIHLRSLRGLESVVLIFLQRAWMPLAEYADLGDTVRQHGVRIVFVCAERLPASRVGRPNLWVLHDRRGDVARTYGAFDLVSGDTVPAVYLLDRFGKLRYYEVGLMPGPRDLSDLIRAVLIPAETG